MKKEMSETWHQEQVFKWARSQQIRHPNLQLLNSSLNGVKLPISLAKKIKAQGMRKGYPDISLPVPSIGYHGLFIEMKKEHGGKISKEQKQWLEKLTALGYYAVVKNGYKEAIQLICSYLEI